MSDSAMDFLWIAGICTQKATGSFGLSRLQANKFVKRLWTRLPCGWMRHQLASSAFDGFQQKVLTIHRPPFDGFVRYRRWWRLPWYCLQGETCCWRTFRLFGAGKGLWWEGCSSVEFLGWWAGEGIWLWQTRTVDRIQWTLLGTFFFQIDTILTAWHPGSYISFGHQQR